MMAIKKGMTAMLMYTAVPESNRSAAMFDMKSWIDKNMSLGRVSSIQPMSLENLFIMRPVGVVSKNRIGALRMASNILLWRILEACNTMILNRRARPRANSAATDVRLPYMAKLVASL